MDGATSISTSISVSGLRVGYDGTEVLRAVSLDVPAGSILALLGPSGCGKTTLLRALAGLERPTAGEVRLGDRLLSGPGTHVPPERRRIGMVFQDWALFPHLTVAQNVAYGLGRGAPAAEVEAALALVGLGGFGDRRPGTLSGGQQQRVALARALAPRPSVLLMDEPFSNLDAALRVGVRAEVADLLARVGITTVFVTHDQAEAFVLGDAVAVMRDGCVVQTGTPAELYVAPEDGWVAAFVGEANLLPGVSAGTDARTACGPVSLHDPHDGPVTVLARPEELVLTDRDGLGNGSGDGPGALGEVRAVEFYGHDTVYVVALAESGAGADPAGPPDRPVRVRAASAPRWGRGDTVRVTHLARPTVAWAAPAQ